MNNNPSIIQSLSPIFIAWQYNGALKNKNKATLSHNTLNTKTETLKLWIYY